MGAGHRVIANKVPLTLAHLTVQEVQPADAIAIAAETGFQNASIRLHSPRPGAEKLSARELDEAVQKALLVSRESGVLVLSIEALVLAPDTDIVNYTPILGAAAKLGARCVLVVAFDNVRSRMLDNFGALSISASRLGLGLEIEFMVFSGIKDLQDAVQVLTEAGSPNDKIVVDVLHLLRSGGGPEDLLRVPAAMISQIQLSDGPRHAGPECLVKEARFDRMFIGEGEFPLIEIMSKRPPAVPLALEIPAERLRLQGISAQERALRARRSFETFVERLSSDGA
ncbi:sugar phosphate isomerase/epimerase [Mesorhizobium sp.]|uniref:sugar phosphate isomerase/epimerase family protein n=1 Tax=Mesorhizobium sp. TaxID=1871066 RepID=UPI0025ED260B|nr:sugar phosphate isomerase/epimerase [Mesorhizobium sp.]